VVAISSVQGKLTIPFRSAYAASKHALQSFCDCLRAETAGSCLSVHVVSPGYIKTNLSVNALTGDGSTYGVLDETTAGGASPDDVADVVMETILRGDQDVVMAPLHNKLAIVLSSVLPNLFSKLMKRRALKFLKHKNKTD
jgi:dehydrogenase/reductase SDR family protein 7B